MSNERKRGAGAGVIHSAEVEADRFVHGSEHLFWRRNLGRAAGGEKLGCSLVELEPGKRSWPYHYHLANEEALYVLEGRGELRLGDRCIPLVAGDYVALPCRPQGAHQTHNTGDTPLRYLCISTMIEPDIAVYPDSDKVGLFAGSAPGGPKDQRTLSTFLSRSATVGYWDGEQ